MSAGEAARERAEDEAAGQKLPDAGAGKDGSVPNAKDGVGIGAGTEANTFEPEEDPDAAKENENP